VAAAYLVRCRAGLGQVGEEVNAGELVALAEEAHAAAPSEATHAMLLTALCFRAGQTLARQEPAYAALAGRGMRALGPQYLLAVALSRPGKLRAACLADPDVRRVVELLRADVRQFPDEPGPWSWAVLRAAHPEEAEPLAQALSGDELGRLGRALDLRLRPASGTAAYAVFWAAQAEGKEAEGREALRRCADRGVPLPLPEE
jgi:hypothetical protein